MTDDEVDLSDSPALDGDFFKRAELRLPTDRSVVLRVDEETFEWFQEQGPDFRIRMNAALKIYADAHR